jgi:methyltransferase-like protein
LQCYLASLVDLHIREPGFVVEVSARPVASPLARLQAAEDQPITNLQHRYVKLSPVHRLVLPLLDGSRDVAALIEALTGLVLGGQFTMEQNGQPIRDPEQVRQLFRGSLRDILRRLADSALLVG